MKQTLNVGIIGVGQIAQKTHLPLFTNNPKARVVAVADVNEELVESVATKFGVKKFYKDYRDLLALNKVDAVSICTPPFNHMVITCDAAEAGKHVLCEKPMSMNAGEAEKMVETCKKAGVKLGICSSRVRFSSGIEKAREYVQTGKLGRVYYVRSNSLDWRFRGRPGIDNRQGKYQQTWFLDSSKSGGGALIDIGCYDLDAILYILGSPQPMAVSAMTFKGVGDQPGPDIIYDVEEHASLMVRFKDGIVATIETVWAVNVEKGEGPMVFFGTKGGLKLNPFVFYTEKEEKPIAKTEDVSAGRTNLFIDDFVIACLEDRSPKTPGEDGLKVMQIINMAYLSAKLGREVTLKDLSTQ